MSKEPQGLTGELLCPVGIDPSCSVPADQGLGNAGSHGSQEIIKACQHMLVMLAINSVPSYSTYKIPQKREQAQDPINQG